MPIYTVHEPAGSGSHDGEAADKVVFIREGFSWPAFLISPLWLGFHAMWLELGGYLVAAFVLTMLPELLGATGFWPSLAAFAFSFLFALEANQLRRWSLQRKGYRHSAVVSGEDIYACEQKFFSQWLGNADMAALRPAARRESWPSPALPSGTVPGGGASNLVIGSFPDPDAR